MPADFAYNEATNTVTAYNNTSGAPKPFAGFVAADRGNSVSPQAARSPAANLTLTHQVRPVGKLALQITFTAAGKTAETD